MSSNISGVDNLMKKLNNLEQLFQSGVIEQAVQRGCMTVQAEAIQLCPVDKGELRQSIMTKVDRTNEGVTGKVYTNKEYAPYVELGTGSKGKSTYKGDLDITYNEQWAGQPAQPYLYPALKNNEDAVLKDIKKDIDEEIRKVIGNAK